MEIPKGYKQTEVGVIPQDWEVFPIGSIADVKTGPFGSALHADDYVFDGTPIITVEHIGKVNIDITNGVPRVSNEDFKRLIAYSLKESDIVFSRVGSVDRCSYVSKNEDGWLFSGRLLRVRIKNDLDPLYLTYHLQTSEAKQRVLSVAVGLAMPSINTKILNGVLVASPPKKNEQERIAKALSEIDELIAGLGEQIEKKRQIKEGAMQQLLTGKTRLPGFRQPWVDIIIEDVANRFDNLRIPIAETLRIKGDIPYYGANGIVDYVKGFTHEGEFVLLAEDGANSLTDYPIRFVSGKIWVNNHAHVLQAKKGIADNLFLSYAFKLIDFESSIVGSGRAKLNAETMMKLCLSIPSSITEQTAIAQILSDMDDEIRQLEAERDKYTLIKQGMMQELLTGKTRLV